MIDAAEIAAVLTEEIVMAAEVTTAVTIGDNQAAIAGLPVSRMKPARLRKEAATDVNAQKS
jgi:hypothetical protein